VIVHAQDNFRRTIETTLDVSIDYPWLSSIHDHGDNLRTLLVLEAATAEIYDFDSTLRGVSQQNILNRVTRQFTCKAGTTNLWLEITVHYAVMPHQAQRHYHLAREAPYQSGREPNKPVCLDQFVQIDAEQFHSDAEVIAEVKVFSHLDNMMFFFLVLEIAGKSLNVEYRGMGAYPFAKIIQDLDLHQRLVMETFLVTDDLNRNRFACLVISTV
jgi:hypothetical protein